MADRTWYVTLDDMYSLTWQKALPGMENLWQKSTVLYYLMDKNGRIETLDGGLFIEERVEYKKNPTTQFIGRGGTVTLQETDNVTATYWDWKTHTGHVVVFNYDEVRNRGSSMIKSRVKKDIESLRNSVIDEINELFITGDGTGQNPDGFANIISTTPTTGTVGGRDRSTDTWWRNQTLNMSGLEVSVQLLPYMRRMYNLTGQWGRGKARFCDLLVTAYQVTERYEEEAFDKTTIRITDKAITDLGAGDLAFKGAPLVWDPVMSDLADYRIYFVNTNAIRVYKNSFQWMDMLPAIEIANQPGDRVKHILSSYNMVTSNPQKLGVIYNIDV